jgi:hypothetical protein
MEEQPKNMSGIFGALSPLKIGDVAKSTDAPAGELSEAACERLKELAHRPEVRMIEIKFGPQ